MLSVSQVQPKDIPLLERVLGADHAHFYRNRLRRNGTVLAAWIAGQPAGAVYVSWERADEPEVRRLLPNVPLVHRLHVREDLRHQGIGAKLIVVAEHLALHRGRPQIGAGVNVSNEGIAAWYRRLGYREWGHGVVKTHREFYAADGSVHVTDDFCQIFVKDLGALP